MNDVKENEKLNKNNNEELVVFDELDTKDCGDDSNDLIKQLRETKENKSLFLALL